MSWPNAGTMSCLALQLLSVGACVAPPSELPNDVALRYGVSHMSGDVSFFVKTDGTAEYTSRDGTESKTVTGVVTSEELTVLAQTLSDNSFCSLTSSRSTGVPDEARPTVRVRIDDLDCKVTLWDNEWSDDPSAEASLDAVESLGRKLSERGKPVVQP